MRRSILKVFPVVVICAFLFVSANAAAENLQNKDQKKDRPHVSIGYNQYYMWWDPVWSKMDMPRFFELIIGFTDLDFGSDSNFVYNPVISIDLTKGWSLSGSFLYGEFSSSGSNAGVGYFIVSNFSTKRKLDVKKYDAELLLQYKIKDWCKIYIGPKYQGYHIKDSFSLYSITTVEAIAFNDEINFHSAGGGIGTGFTVHMGKGIYLLPNLSGIFLYGKDVKKLPLTTKLFIGGRQNSILIGAIGDLSFAYYIDKIWTTVTLGFKCQFLHYNQRPREEHRQKYDLIFGPHLGFVVTF